MTSEARLEKAMPLAPGFLNDPAWDPPSQDTHTMLREVQDTWRGHWYVLWLTVPEEPHLPIIIVKAPDMSGGASG